MPSRGARTFASITLTNSNWYQPCYPFVNACKRLERHISLMQVIRGGGGGGYSAWKLTGVCRWPLKIGPKKIEEKLNLRPKRSIFVKIRSFCTPKDSFAVGGWEKVPQKDRARSCQSEKRGSKPRHICITHHIGSTPPPPGVTKREAFSWIV